MMESLLISFQQIVDAGLFKGIVLDQSLCLSHMFYADDVIFVGYWSDGSIPVFHMSLFKVPSKVLQILETIRRQFFNGHDLGSHKASWVKWNNVLTDKKRGGLGVSSLFALNRGLMLKWVWKFLTQKDSLWTKVIAAIHGVDGKVNSERETPGTSCWLSILNEVRSLQRT
nr:RNA-directed DNA polymerase, eukaryota, reverse transcriptase zinc-binding domain protein [Tanacetum cinerariifolium]